MEPIKVMNPPVAIKLSKEVAQCLGIDITQDQIRGNYETVGVWNVIKSYEALCISNEYDNSGMFPKIASTEIYGKRKLSNPRQSGYYLEGFVSIKGKKYKAFTSSILIDVDGKVIDIATINAVIK